MFRAVVISSVLLIQMPGVTVQAWVSGLEDPSGSKQASVQTNGLFENCAAQTEIPLAECEALTALYETTSETDWAQSAGWLATDTPCSWFGVGCQDGHVTSLELAENQLTGEIPPELGDLEALEKLDLRNNPLLTGALPADLTGLIQLQEIDFSGTGLCMPVDEAFQNWMASIPVQAVTQTCPFENTQEPPDLQDPTEPTEPIGTPESPETPEPSSTPEPTDLPAPDLGDLPGLMGSEFCSTVTEIPAAECEALVDFYISTEGDYWNYDDRWLETNRPCAWYGVTCLEGHVQKINLPENSVHGPLPASIANLSYLTELNLFNNAVEGNIPAELGSITGLQMLNLSVNRLTGYLPVEIGNLQQLDYLDLSINQLEGSIPPALGNLTQLFLLDLGDNYFTGTIPPELGNLTGLVMLSLYSNLLSGNLPSELGNLTLLEYLSLEGNNFTGQLPETLLQLTDLGYLNFLGTYLCVPGTQAFADWIASIEETYVTSTCATGPFTDCSHVNDISTGECSALTAFYSAMQGSSWKNRTGWKTNNSPCTWEGVGCDLGMVTSLMLSDNNLMGTLPSSISNLQNLQVLVLDHNKISGSIPSSVGGLESLVLLDLSHNKLSGTVPASFEKLKAVQYLILSFNQFTGRIPYQIGSMENLRVLNLESNKFSSTIPGELHSLYYLEILDLSDNGIVDTLYPLLLQELESLRELDLSNNRLYGSIWNEEFWHSCLEVLDLHGNRLSGKITRDIGNMICLERLSLYSNNFTGLIPPAIGQLTRLTELYLNDNLFTGEIPDELFYLTDLRALNLGENRLSGWIPPELGYLPDLELLALGYNGLSGSIPEELGNLQNLTVLTLFDNNFTGPVPEELGNLTNLQTLLIERTSLEGELPAQLTNLTSLQKFYYADTGLCAPPDEAFQNWLAGIPNKAVTKNCVWASSVKSLSPAYSFSGNEAFTLTVNGSDFTPGSVVYWEDLALNTSYSGTGKLTASVPAGLISTPKQAQVSVYTPTMKIVFSEPTIYTALDYSPDFNQKLSTNKVTFDWDDVPGANLYSIQLSLSKTFSTYVLNTTSSTSKYAFGTALTNGKTYYWRIRARSGSTWGPWTSAARFISMTPPAAPGLIAPLAGAYTNDTTVELSWKTATNGQTYRIQLSQSSKFTTTLINEKLAAGVTTYTSAPLTDATYYWRVRGIDEVGVEGAWSAVRSFTVDTVAPGVPKLYTPKDLAYTADTTPALTVTAVAGAKSYIYQLSAAEDFSAIAWEKSGGTSLSASVQPYGMYWWRAKAVDAAGNQSDWSGSRRLEISFLSAPKAGWYSTDLTPAFSWAAVSGAKGYELCIYRDEETEPAYTRTLGLVTSHTVPAASALTPGHYRWSMSVTLVSGTKSTSERAFTLTDAYLPAPALTRPANGAAMQARTPEFIWSVVAEAVQYELWVDNTSTFTSREFATVTSETSAIPLTDLADGVYSWKVRAIDELGVPGVWSAARTVRVDNIPPKVPKLYTPANRAAVAGTPKFTWLAASGAKYYHFQLLDGEGRVVAQSAETLTVLSYKPAPVQPGSYTWQVRAGDTAGNWSTWSMARTIVIKIGTPAAPVLISPAHGSSTDDPTPDLSWGTVVYGTYYQAQISKRSDFATLVQNQNLAEGLTVHTAPELSPGTYYWRVRARNANYTGAWSSVWKLIITVAP